MTKTILIIDDSEIQRYLAERTIKKAMGSVCILHQSDGKEALKFLEELEQRGKKNFPSIILLDINMPLMDGFDFLESFTKLKQTNESYGEIKIIMYSSSELWEEVERALAYDCVAGHISKALPPDEMITLLNKHASAS